MDARVELVAADAVACVAAATGLALARERGEQLGPRVRVAVDWSAAAAEDVVAAARLHRVCALLVAGAADLSIPAAILDELRVTARAQTVRSLQLAHETTRAVAALQGAGIPALVFKGTALSIQTTGAVAGRGSADIDLLVAPQDVESADRALRAAGWVGDRLGPDGWWRRWYLTARRERSYRSPACEIDLHWRVGWHRTPLPEPAVLIGRAGAVEVAGRRLPTLCESDALAAACYHAAVDRYARLRQLVDVARLIERPGIGLPADASWRLRRLVAEAVSLTDALLGPLPQARRFVREGTDLARARALWEYSSTRAEWPFDTLSLGQQVQVYRDSARFAGAPAAVAMALTDAFVPPERIDPTLGPAGVVRAVGAEATDLVRRRVLGRPAVSRPDVDRPGGRGPA